MSKHSDVRVEAVEVRFREEQLATPLLLSSGAINDVNYARVIIQMRTRRGQLSQGHGGILLSDLWAFPDPAYSHAQKDAVMRALCEAVATALRGDGDYGDPLEKGHGLEQMLSALVTQVEQKFPWLQPGAFPYLAALNCLAPFDAAIHDAWGRALGGSVYQFYSADYLNADLAHYWGDEFRDAYPMSFFSRRRPTLAIQHIVGIADNLEQRQTQPSTRSAAGQPQELADWIRRDGIFCFKVKSHGHDPLADAQRLAAIYAIAQECGIPATQIRLSLDPNEACAGPEFMLELLDWLVVEAPAVLAALDYIEQPVSRDLARQTFTLHAVSQRKPVIIDESLDRLENLALLAALGWSGLALKSCKGQTHCLLAYCWGKRHRLFMTMQDLTNPGLALVHSANLCAQLDLSVDYFEGNSRQFMPQACREEQAAFPEYFHVVDGRIQLPLREPLGLY